jgi:hypothetical protein
MPDMNDRPLCVRGCLKVDGATPYQASHGAYCVRCWGRVDAILGLAGELALHLLRHGLTSPGSADVKVDQSKEPPVPFNQAAFDDVNELFRTVVFWVDVWARELGDPSPLIPAWRNRARQVVGLPAALSPETGAELVGALARWVRNRLDRILSTGEVDTLDHFDEVVSDLWRMNARWPRVDRPAYSRMPCPRQDCGRPLAVYPPAFQGDARRIVCQGGHWYPEEEYEHLILVFEQDAKEQKKVERVARRLAEKYGIGRKNS